MEDWFKMRVNRAGRIQPSYRMWPRQRGAMREVNRYGMSKMADAAVLVFEGLVVPVAGCLESKRQHYGRHENGQESVCRSARHFWSQYLVHLIPAGHRLLWQPSRTEPDSRRSPGRAAKSAPRRSQSRTVFACPNRFRWKALREASQDTRQARSS
jgi:hypothetical protein